MTPRTCICYALLLCLLATPTTAAANLLDDLKLPDLRVPSATVPGLDALTGGDDPIISTSIADAQTEIPYLDDYTPKYPIPLDVLRPDRAGVFRLPSGAYEFDAQSYCLQPGTYGPTRGDGYSYAPLKGSGSSVIQSILRESANHPEIPQEDVQMLIWAVLARTKIDEMPQEASRAASKLLTKEQLTGLRKSALDVLSEDELGGILGKVTGPLRSVLEAENRLRERLTEADSSYEELEEIAILRGEHQRGKGSRTVPAGRWSYNPGGYFVRYIPSGYPETHIELYVPEIFSIERDDKGRITMLSDRNGASIEVAYDDTVTPISFTGDSGALAYALKSVRFAEKLPSKKGGDLVDRKWTDVGWTLCGVPSGTGKASASSEKLKGIDARYQRAVALSKQSDSAAANAMKALGTKKPSLSQIGVADMSDLSHLRTALAEVIGEEQLKDTWTANMLDRLTNAWQSAFQQRVTAVQVAALPAAMIGLFGAAESDGPGPGPGGGGSGGPGSGAGFGPGGGVAAPGDTAQQRLAQSGRPSRGCDDPGGDGLEGPLKQALKDHGLNVANENLDIRVSGSDDCRLIRFHVPLGPNNNPLPKLACAQQAIANGAKDGSLEPPTKILFGSVQQCGDQTLVNVRTTDLETGTVTGGGRGRSEGTGDSATTSATGDALGGLGL